METVIQPARGIDTHNLMVSGFFWCQAMIACRSCGHPDLLPILSLGSMPLANALLTSEQLTLPEETFPLDLVFCPQCTLVQITETVSPEKLFRENFYLSSFSDKIGRAHV